MKNANRSATIVSKLLILTLLVGACTKTRQAALPDEAQENTFAISEIETESANIKTDDQLKALSLGESAKATSEKGIVTITDVKVPERIKYMFRGLEISGLTNHDYPIAVSVDKQFVTAFKIVNDLSELTAIEKQLAQVKDEVILQKKLQKTTDLTESKTIIANLKKISSSRQLLMSRKSNNIYVPLFKYKIAAYGVLQRSLNELKEETSVLRLRPTDWAEATHIQISTKAADRMNVGLDPSSTGELDRTFVMDRINNKVMTAGTLKSEYQIPVNLQDNRHVLTLLDVDALHIYEVGSLKSMNLSDSQLEQLKTASANSNVRNCSNDIKTTLPPEEQKDCVLVLRYDVGINYVKPELPPVDNDGNRAPVVRFNTVNAGQNVGLVQITENAPPKKVESNNELDPRTTIRVVDIKDKEFFFKRTIEDAAFAASSSGLAPGMAGAITIVKFEFEEKRIVLRKADKIVQYKTTTTDSDYEEIMSIPVRYLKLDSKDSTGTSYSSPRVTAASKSDAQYIELDWTSNSIPQGSSPYAAIYQGCINGIADQQVVDVDMRVDKGVLNFSQKYTVALSDECTGIFSATNSYNGAPDYQSVARIKERISLKLNDGSTDVPFVPQVPFKAQHAMGYGVWTLGVITPDSYGQMRREGNEQNFPMVHDFRNGKVLTYTLTGLPTDDPEMRELYITIAKEVVESWNKAYHQAFKGSPFDRSGNYIELQIAGENGVTAHLGDLDKNIFHIENKFADHGVLGVSQVGFNPRSAIVVADSLILYGGNVKQDVYNSFSQMKKRAEWDKKKEAFKAALLKNLQTQQAQATANSPATPTIAADNKVALKLQNLKNSRPTLKAVKRKASEKFQYSSPTSEYGWMDRAFRQITDQSNLSANEIQAILSKEFLKTKGGRISKSVQTEMARFIKSAEIRSKMFASMRNGPACMRTSAEITNQNFEKLSFKDAFRVEAINTMVHEMGHSQGLTHNFIGSYDKKNYKNEDGSDSKRNYSSVMDYLTPGKFSWDGVGTYDIHAIRASHLGLLEVSDSFLASAEAKDVKLLGKYIDVNAIKNKYGNNSWVQLSKSQIQHVLKPYKYCTDIDVGNELACERHDFGSSAEEIIESYQQDFENNYISNYHGWDRLKFNWTSAMRAHAMSKYYMMRMRSFLDETFYKLIIERPYQTDSQGKVSQEFQKELQSFFQATLKSYLFFHQLIMTPDTNSEFESMDRFVAQPYDLDVLDKDGKPTGQKTKKIEIVEKRTTENLILDNNDERLDTVGIEQDKIFAMNLLTLRGFPTEKYESNNIEFSYLDFENFLLEMRPDQSLFTKTMTGLFLDQLPAMFSNADVNLQPLPSEKVKVTQTMTAYAAIYSVLNLQNSAADQENNFANLFKVGSSVGNGPGDRLALSRLGVNDQSKTRLSFWSFDGANAAKTLFSEAGRKKFFMDKRSEIQPLLAELFVAQAENSDTSEKVDLATKNLGKKLNELNANGEVADQQASIEAQIGLMIKFNRGMILAATDPSTETDLEQIAHDYANYFPLFALDQNIIRTMSPTHLKAKAPSGLVSEHFLETTYGSILKNIEFLSSLTGMTDPEYTR